MSGDNSSENQTSELNAQSEQQPAKQEEMPEMSLKSFLEDAPPDTIIKILDFSMTSGVYLKMPEPLLYCANKQCVGPRLFHTSDSMFASSEWTNVFLKYVCRNCGRQLHRFAIMYRTAALPIGYARKYGQFPPFGPHTPPKLLRLVQPDRELYLQGRRAEIHGLGIGAFAYYRRVVENQRNLIIEQIIKVAKAVGISPNAQALFEAALNQFQFSKSVEMIHDLDLIPQVLMINGENPLTLLHAALSKGLHDAEMTDNHCLELAQSIRTILTELAERASLAIKEDREIQDALKVLKSIPRGKAATATRAEDELTNETSSPANEK